MTLSIHSLIAGVTLGISTAAGASVLLMAILAHKGAAGFALGSTFREAAIPPHTRIPALLVFVGSTPLGVILGGAAIDIFGSGDGAAVAWFKAVAAGTFLYIATLDIVREEFFRRRQSRSSSALGDDRCRHHGTGRTLDVTGRTSRAQ